MQRLSREEAEADLVFLGLVVMENRLKPETSGVLGVLRDAQIRTIMVTGKTLYYLFIFNYVILQL